MIETALGIGGGPLRRDALRALLPAGVGVGVCREGGRGELGAFPEELALLGPRATDERRRNFALGRAAAHAALADLKVAVAPVGRGSRGEPLWPEGLVGAIAHSGGIGVAIVGRAEAWSGLGVDVEMRDREVQDAAARLVCTPAERAWADAAASSAERRLRRLAIFCGKEAVFKALYPIASVYLGFGDAELTWRHLPPGFGAALRKAAGPGLPGSTRLDIRCALADDALVAALAVPRVGDAAGSGEPGQDWTRPSR